MTKKDSFLYRVNKICAVLLVVWVCWPWLCQNTGLAGGFLLAFGWCVTAVFVTNKYTVGGDGMLMIFYALYMGMSFLLTGRTYGAYSLYYHLSMVTLFFLPYYMARFYFKRNEKKFMGRIAIVAMVFMVVGCLTSIYYTQIDPNIMKTISQNMDTEFLEYRKSGIGSFGFIYMVMFAVIATIGFLKANFKALRFWPKVFLLFFCAIGIKCLFDSTFTTSLLLLFVGILMILITAKNSKAGNIITYFIVLAFSFVIIRQLGNVLVNIKLESDDVTTRLREIGGLLLGQEGGTNTDSRMKYFVRSVNCFLEYPLFGYNFAIFPQIKIGGHSEWVDIFGVYGLVGGIPLVSTILIKLKNTLSITKSLDYPFYGLLIFVFIIYGFVDPFLRLYNIGFIMFLLIPCIGCISKAFQKEGEDK